MYDKKIFSQRTAVDDSAFFCRMSGCIRIVCSFKSCLILRFFRQQCRSFPCCFLQRSFSFRNARQHPLRRDDVGPVRLSARNRREPSEAVYRSVRCSQLCTAVRRNQEEQLRSDLDEYLNAASAETIDILAEGAETSTLPLGKFFQTV